MTEIVMKECRKESKMTQKELAMEIGCSQGMVSLIENRKVGTKSVAKKRYNKWAYRHLVKSNDERQIHMAFEMAFGTR